MAQVFLALRGIYPSDPNYNEYLRQEIERQLYATNLVVGSVAPQKGALGKAAVGEAIEKAIAKGKSLWNAWESYEKVKIGENLYAKIGDRLYTQHAIERMMPKGLTTNGRSISPNFIEDVLSNGKLIDTYEVNGVTRQLWRNGTVDVVTEQNGKLIITVITK